MKLKLDKKQKIIIGFSALALLIAVVVMVIVVNPLAITVRMDFEDQFRDDLDSTVTVNGIEVYPNNPQAIQSVNVGDTIVIEGIFGDTRATVRKTSYFLGGFFNEYLMEDGVFVGGDNTYFKYTYVIVDTVQAQSCSSLWVEQPDGLEKLETLCISATVKTRRFGLFLKESGAFPNNREFRVTLDIYHDNSDDNLVCEKHYTSEDDVTRVIKYVLRDYRDRVGSFNTVETYDTNSECLNARTDILFPPEDDSNGETMWKIDWVLTILITIGVIVGISVLCWIIRKFRK